MQFLLNMANQYSIGGGVVNGCGAQEENMYRRTDCWIRAKEDDNVIFNSDSRVMTYETALGDTAQFYPDRICFKGKEDTENYKQSYKLMNDDNIFRFNELRCAAIDTREWNVQKINVEFDEYQTGMETRIINQFQTLIENHQKHVVLSAFGCGVFINNKWPNDIQDEVRKTIATLYKTYVHRYKDHFKVIAFAIYDKADQTKYEQQTSTSQLFADILRSQDVISI